MIVRRALIACSLVGLASLFAAGRAGDQGYSAWVALTVVVELLALGVAARVRQRFEPGEPSRITWDLIVGFLAVRTLAQLRLLSFYFDFVPGFVESSPSLTHIYTVWLRYLYTIADLLMIGGLSSTIRSYRALGLHFELRGRDWALIAVVAAMPLSVIASRDQLWSDPHLAAPEISLTIYRMVAAVVSAAIAALSLAVLRFVQQMGGGQLALVWGAIGAAGLARALSFVALALLSGISPAAGDLAEQSMLWLFASAWFAGVMWQWQIGRGRAGGGAIAPATKRLDMR
ncbi:MAG: hypothetical protein IPK80_27455 [Nannocystis sp.]|nr:hypothetical protein [Nannocystis sp.]